MKMEVKKKEEGNFGKDGRGQGLIPWRSHVSDARACSNLYEVSGDIGRGNCAIWVGFGAK